MDDQQAEQIALTVALNGRGQSDLADDGDPENGPELTGGKWVTLGPRLELRRCGCCTCVVLLIHPMDDPTVPDWLYEPSAEYLIRDETVIAAFWAKVSGVLSHAGIEQMAYEAVYGVGY